MSDRELLVLAAKAAGIPLEFRVLKLTEGTEYPCYEDTDSVSVSPSYIPVIKWNPKPDDGDAMRLAVKLGMCVTIFTKSEPFGAMANTSFEEFNGDIYAATRRATVRSAAEIWNRITAETI